MGPEAPQAPVQAPQEAVQPEPVQPEPVQPEPVAGPSGEPRRVLRARRKLPAKLPTPAPAVPTAAPPPPTAAPPAAAAATTPPPRKRRSTRREQLPETPPPPAAAPVDDDQDPDLYVLQEKYLSIGCVFNNICSKFCQFTHICKNYCYFLVMLFKMLLLRCSLIFVSFM